MTYDDLKRPSAELGPLLVRLNIGLEDPADLIADLEQASGSGVVAVSELRLPQRRPLKNSGM